MVEEFDLHSDGSERLDEMRLLGKDQPGAAGLEDRLRARVQHGAQASFKHANDAARASLGAVFAAQSGGSVTPSNTGVDL